MPCSLSCQASKYYPIPLWGPILLGTIAGCGGLFLPLDKGLRVRRCRIDCSVASLELWFPITKMYVMGWEPREVAKKGYGKVLLGSLPARAWWLQRASTSFSFSAPCTFFLAAWQGVKAGAPWPLQSAFYGSVFFHLMVHDPNVGE